jgi:hypothetical protein
MSLLDALLLDPAPFQVWIACRTDGLKGSGTASDPYDGSMQARFDARVNELPANTRVYLGPGTFMTNGYADNVAGGWQAKPGLKIVGSGIDVTVLQQVNATTNGKHYYVVGHALASGGAPTPVDACEVSDLTIDCNLDGSSNTALSAFGAVRLFGNHVRVARVKVIHWGTKQATTPCFAIAVITGDRTAGLVEVVNAGVEGCMVVNPEVKASNVGPNTAIHAGGTEAAAAFAEAYGRAPYIRNCFVDCDSPAATPEYRGLSMGWCRGGVVEGNQVHNTKYGGPYQSKTSTLDIVVRNNFYKNVAKGPYWNLGTTTSPITATSLVRLNPDPPTTKAAEVTTNVDHGLAVGERVRVSGASFAEFNGYFVVTNVPATNKFRYEMIARPSGDSTSSAYVEKIFGAGRIIVERNIIELATGSTGQIAIHVHDASPPSQTPDYAHGTVIVRDNKIRYVDGQFDSAFAGSGIEVNGVKHLTVNNNVIECAPANPLKNSRSGAVTYFNNRTPSGVLIRGVDSVTGKKYDELETEAEDAFVMAMFNER